MKKVKSIVFAVGVSLCGTPIFHSAFAQSSTDAATTLLEIQSLKDEIAGLRDLVERQQFEMRKLKQQVAEQSQTNAQSISQLRQDTQNQITQLQQVVPAAQPVISDNVNPYLAQSSGGDSWNVNSTQQPAQGTYQPIQQGQATVGQQSNTAPTGGPAAVTNPYLNTNSGYQNSVPSGANQVVGANQPPQTLASANVSSATGVIAIPQAATDEVIASNQEAFYDSSQTPQPAEVRASEYGVNQVQTGISTSGLNQNVGSTQVIQGQPQIIDRSIETGQAQANVNQGAEVIERGVDGYVANPSAPILSSDQSYGQQTYTNQPQAQQPQPINAADVVAAAGNQSQAQSQIPTSTGGQVDPNFGNQPTAAQNQVVSQNQTPIYPNQVVGQSNQPVLQVPNQVPSQSTSAGQVATATDPNLVNPNLVTSTGVNQQVAGLSLPQPTPTILSEDEYYDRGFDLLKQSKYDDAVVVFREQLARHPQGGLSDDAHYWIAEAMFISRKPDEAKPHLRAIIDNYPQSSRLPDAMLKTAYIEQDAGNMIEARILFQEIVSQHPSSNAAIAAKNRLASISGG